MRLLVTRPEPDATATAAALRAQGHEVIVDPMLRIVPVEASIPDAPYQAVISTSANGVRALAARPGAAALRRLPFLAVGEATAAAARETGFDRVLVGKGNAQALGGLAAETLHPAQGPILYAAARDRAGRLDGALEAGGFAVTTLVLYAAEPALRLSEDAEAALREGRLDGVLFYSRRTAESFADCVRRANLEETLRGLAAFAISEAAAAPLRPFGFGRIAVAERPDGESLAALVSRLAASH